MREMSTALCALLAPGPRLTLDLGPGPGGFNTGNGLSGQRLVDAMVKFGPLGKQYANFKIATVIGG